MPPLLTSFCDFRQISAESQFMRELTPPLQKSLLEPFSSAFSSFTYFSVSWLPKLRSLDNIHPYLHICQGKMFHQEIFTLPCTNSGQATAAPTFGNIRLHIKTLCKYMNAAVLIFDNMHKCCICVLEDIYLECHFCQAFLI